MKKIPKKFIPFLIVFICILVISGAYSSIVTYSCSKMNGITIVLDAGHGARDGGSVGTNGTIEKDINLTYTLALRDKLIESGFKVVLTRSNDEPLYSLDATNKKQSEMNARFKIIENANPNLIISIHMNSFSSPNVRGASTYYRKDDESSKLVGDYIQGCLHSYCNAPNEKSKVGDYYMLNCTYYTAVLVECGFLSNPDEEKLLNSSDYRETLVNAIYNGVLLYFGNA